MNWQELLVGVALVLVVEGLIPFASPGRYRKLVEVISNIEDSRLRIAGAAACLPVCFYFMWFADIPSQSLDL